LRPRVYRDRPQLARHEIARPTRIDRLHDSSQFVLSGKLWRGWSAQSVELLTDITTAPSRCATDPHPARPSFGAMRLYRSVLIDFFPKCFNRSDVSWPIVRTKRVDLTASSFLDMSKFQSALYRLSIYPQTGRNAPYAQLFFSVEANNFFRGNSHRNSPMYRVPSHGVKGIFVRVLPVSLVSLPDSRSHLAEKRQAYGPAVLFDLCDLTVLCVSSENPNG
jgi:hypothetical protein